MRKTQNSLFLFFIVLFCGCQSQNIQKKELTPPPPPPNVKPPPPPNVKPPTPPPSFIPSIKRLAEIQINPIPHPFSVNGEVPFAIWVDGKRLQLSNSEIKQLTKSLNIKYQAPNNTAEIHQGKGWLYPLIINK